MAVISQCVKGTTSVRRAAALLGLSPRQVKRLKRRFRSGGAAAMAHAGRGRASPRRTSILMRQRILHLARTTYAGFNDHHLAEKLRELEGITMGRETLRQLLRAAGIGPPRKRRPPAHRQRHPRRRRAGEMLQVDASPHDWLEGHAAQRLRNALVVAEVAAAVLLLLTATFWYCRFSWRVVRRRR